MNTKNALIISLILTGIVLPFNLLWGTVVTTAMTIAMLCVCLVLSFLLVLNPSKKTARRNVGCPYKEPYKILIGDDVSEIRTLLEVILKKAGYEVVSCANGLEVGQQAMVQKFDVIMIDLNMPGIDGFEVARNIRSQQLNRKTHLIALTASDEEQLDGKHIKAGFDELLEKPVRMEKLLRRVALAVAKTRQIQVADDGSKIISSLTGDPDYKKTIERFMNDLPNKVEAIKTDFEQGNLKDLALKVHSLKGLGGFAGFPVFTEKAKEIEVSLGGEKIDELRKQVNELILLCRNTRLSRKK